MENLRKLLPGAVQRHTLRVVKTDEQSQRPPEPTYACGICKDVGYTRCDVPYGHELFGKPVPCQCKMAEYKQRQQQRLEALSGIIHYTSYQDATFASFNRHVPGVRTAYLEAKNYANEPEGWLVLLGLFGCGKTHLAVAIAKQRLEAGDTVLVQTVPDLLDQLRNAFSPSSDTAFNDLFEQMKKVDLLVLDDYGAENTTPWAVEKLFQIFNYRYNMALPTVVTSNNVTLEGIDPRVRSRLNDKRRVTKVRMLEAQDYREFGENQEEEE